MNQPKLPHSFIYFGISPQEYVKYILEENLKISFISALYAGFLYVPARLLGFASVFTASFLVLGGLSFIKHHKLMKINKTFRDYVGRNYKVMTANIIRSNDGRRQVRHYRDERLGAEYHVYRYDQLTQEGKLVLGNYMVIFKNNNLNRPLSLTTDEKGVLPFRTHKQLGLPLWVALIDKQNQVLKVQFYLGLSLEQREPKEGTQPLAKASVLLIEQMGEEYFLYRLTEKGFYVGDTWHLSLEEAKGQAEFEYGDSLGEWRLVSEYVEDVINYATPQDFDTQKVRNSLLWGGQMSKEQMPHSSSFYIYVPEGYIQFYISEHIYLAFIVSLLGALFTFPDVLIGMTVVFTLFMIYFSISITKEYFALVDRDKQMVFYIGLDYEAYDPNIWHSHDRSRQIRFHACKRLVFGEITIQPDYYERLTLGGEFVLESYIVIPKEHRVASFPINLLLEKWFSKADGKTALNFSARKEPEQQLWVALIDEQDKTLKVNFYLALPPELRKSPKKDEPLALPRLLLLEEISPISYLLYRLTEKGHYVGDTWHFSMQEAKQQAEFEFGKALGEWRAVPEDVEDTLLFALSPN